MYIIHNNIITTTKHEKNDIVGYLQSLDDVMCVKALFIVHTHTYMSTFRDRWTHTLVVAVNAIVLNNDDENERIRSIRYKHVNVMDKPHRIIIAS